jgi:zinc transport system substrate-binding protein
MATPFHQIWSRSDTVARSSAVAVTLLLIAFSVPLTSCDSRRDSRAQAPASNVKAETLTAVVTVPPLRSLVEPLLPAGSHVQTLMAPGRSEHGYEFTPSDLAALSGADLVVWVGLGLEPQVDAFIARQAVGPQVRLKFADAVGVSSEGDGPGDSDGHDHDHGHEHAGSHAESDDGHHHGGVDPHLWVDPVLVKKLIPNIQASIQHALERRGQWNDAAQASLADATAKLTQRVDQVDAEYAKRLKPLAGKAIVTHHAAFARLAERYGLRVAAVIRNVEGAEPDAGKLAEVVDAIKRENASAIFIEPQFDASMARRLAESAGVQVGTLDPLGMGDWFATMNANLDELTRVLKP